jgi:hypothetical protein
VLQHWAVFEYLGGSDSLWAFIGGLTFDHSIEQPLDLLVQTKQWSIQHNNKQSFIRLYKLAEFKCSRGSKQYLQIFVPCTNHVI